jgi:transposase
MTVEDYSDEYKADAVALYESTPRGDYKSIAVSPGIDRVTLREGAPLDRENSGFAVAGPSAGETVRAKGTVSEFFA